MSTKRLSKRHRMVPNAGDRVSRVFFALCKNIGTPVALGAWLRYKYGEHAQLASMTIDACDYTHADSFHMDYICISYLSKYKGLKTNIDTKAVALQAFKQAEISCAETNKRFVEEQVGVPAVEAVISLAQRKISKTIGVLDPPAAERGLSFAALRDACRWGPGTTFSLSGEAATVANKICESRISVTPSALPLLQKVMSDDYLWHKARGISSEGPISLLSTEFQLVRGSRIAVVPKNAKTDRTIGIEPTGNLFLQLGIGSYIRSQLLRVGINLQKDQSRNRRLAQRAVDEGLATIDLKSASDSISVQAMLQLFPLEWVDLLGQVRSPSYYLEGKWHSFEKWSSMGNGYTFEVESLIFWALASSVADYLELSGAVSVYGDDVILPCGCVALFRDVLSWLGFTVNETKSFSTGLFRESCGIHVFDGHDVTPIYQKEIPDVLEEVHRLANRIGRLAYRMGDYNYLDPRLRASHAAAIADVVIRYCVPLSSKDDDGFALPISELSKHALKGASGYLKLPILAFRPTSVEADGAALLAYKLRFGVPVFLNGKLALRRRGSYSARRRWYPVRTDADWLI